MENENVKEENEVVVEETKVAQAKADLKTSKPVTKKKKEKKPSKLGKMIKESASELKKVSWPTFGKVVKQTGIVLAVVLVFGAVLFGIDRLLSLLFNVLVSNL